VAAPARPPGSQGRMSGRSSAVEVADRAVAWVLRVQPQPPRTRETAAETSSRPLEVPLLISAVRCTLRYVVLPFVLPFLGIATGATLGIVTGAALAILLTLDVIAAAVIVATLRRMWRLQHPRRWLYLPAALALALLVGLFFMNDARVLLI
jgi:hypothetical protein